MNPREKVATQEFSVDTGLSPEAIREAGRHAAEASGRFLEGSIVEAGSVDSAVGYLVQGPGGFVDLMEIMVSWEEIGGGKRRVELEVGEFQTDRMVLWGFVPIGPKSVTAMGPLKRFSARLRKELACRPDGAVGLRPDRTEARHRDGAAEAVLRQTSEGASVNTPSVMKAGGLALMVVMMILMVIGTYSLTTFVVWGILAMVGGGISYMGFKLDEWSDE